MHGTPCPQLCLRWGAYRQAEDFRTITRDVSILLDEIQMFQEALVLVFRQKVLEVAYSEELIGCVAYEFFGVLTNDPDEMFLLSVKGNEKTKALYGPRNVDRLIFTSEQLRTIEAGSDGMSLLGDNVMKPR
jgi:hypothetical protein